MEQLKNLARTTLDGTINSSVTSVVVDDGSVFPSTGDFRVLVESELMLVTARSGDTLTVTRGIEGTTAAGHNSLTKIEHLWTKGGVEALVLDLNKTGPYASRPTSARAGTMYTASDLLAARWVYDGSNWSLINPVALTSSKAVDLTGWTALNHGTSTFTNKNGILHANVQSAGTVVRGYYKSLPTPPYKHTIVCSHMIHEQTGLAWGVGVRENSTGKLRLLFHTTNNIGRYVLERWNTATSFAATIVAGRQTTSTAPVYLRLHDDNTNWIWSVSRDGLNYTTFYTETRNTDFTADQIVFVAANNIAYTGSPAIDIFLLGGWVE